MGRPCPLLGDGITDDTLLHIASFLPAAKDLLNLGLACPRFAAKIIPAPSIGAGGAAAAMMWRTGYSLMMQRELAGLREA